VVVIFKLKNMLFQVVY